jgi:hypothetical protein
MYTANRHERMLPPSPESIFFILAQAGPERGAGLKMLGAALIQHKPQVPLP